MSDIINVYCDESCHLENDGQKAMVLGALSLPDEIRREASNRLAEIKIRNGMPADFEIKWTKISPSKIQMYLDVVDYFFDDDDLKFRCVVIPNKANLDHSKFDQDHDEWYYKMYFLLISFLMKPGKKYQIYLDIKDTRSKEKVAKLHDILCSSHLDYSKRMIKKVQQVRSHEVSHIQIADMLIGAMSFKFGHRQDRVSKAKQTIVDRISKRSGYSLDRSTLYREEKFNIFVWEPS